MKRLILISLVLVGLIGCEASQNTPDRVPITQKEYDSVLVVLLDASGSFIPRLQKSGFPFCERAIDNFYRDRAGEGNDLVIIAQISGGVTRTLLFRGTPREFREKFKSSAQFQRFILEKADQNGSRVHGGVSDALSYLLRMSGVKEGRTRSAVLALSDFEDNSPGGEKERDELLNRLAEYSKTKGCIGFYYVEEPYYSFWQQAMPGTGMKNFSIWDSIHENPDLPKWSD